MNTINLGNKTIEIQPTALFFIADIGANHELEV
jgi:sialic acid synthase SpsE